MATTLKAVLQFTAVPAGGTATLAHGLNVSGTAVVPDAVALDNPAFDYVSSTTTTVTVVNNDTAAGSCDVLCERWHTVERAFGDGAATLPVVPFISRGAAAGGGLLPLDADRIFTKRWDYGTAAIVYYVRTTGSDTNDGLTPATAFATFERALHFMAISDLNLPVIIDVTGMTISADAVLNLGGNVTGGLSFDFDLTATSPNNFFSRQSKQIRSELALVQGLTQTGSAFDATTGLLTVTVSDALTVNALRGKFLVGSVLGDYGVIRSNTGGVGPNTIVVARTSALTAPIAAYGPGATLTFGDAGNFFDQAIYLTALADWNFQGLTLASHGKAVAASVWPAAPVTFALCDIAGLEVNGGAGQVTLDACYVHDASFVQDGGSVSVLQSYFRTMTFTCHGSGATGLNEWIGVIIDNSNSFGGDNIESAYQFYLANALVDGSSSEGVQALFGVSRVQNATIQNSTRSGVLVSNTTTCTLDNVQGTGNTRYGVEGTYGAMVKRVNASAITGALGDTKPGAVAATAWGATPVTDPDQLVRIGT